MKTTLTAGTILAIAAIMSATVGCTTVIKESIGIAKGAKGVYAPIRPAAGSAQTRNLGEYTRIELGEISDSIAGKVPPDLLRGLAVELDKQLSDKKLPTSHGTGKTLVVQGEIIHYEDEKMLGMVLGPLEEVIVRMELIDKSTARVLGVANCIGRTTTRVNKGVRKKTEGLAKAIAKWIASRYPQQD